MTAFAGERAASWLHQHRPNRANISHHYDVGDAFYRLWLDERMVYSCAYFRREDDSLATAQSRSSTTSAASCAWRPASGCSTSGAAGAR